MPKSRSFALPEQGEPMFFDVAGIKFRARPRIASGAVLRLGEAVSGGDEDDPTSVDAGALIDALLGFFRSALYPDDYARFKAMLDDPELAVPLSTLNEIASWMAQEYTNDRPTGQPSPPTSPSGSYGEGSTGTTTGQASISSISPQIAPTT